MLTTEWQLLGEDFVVSSYGDLYIRLYAKYSEQQIENNRTWVMYETRAYFTGNYIISQTPTSSTLKGTGIGETTTNYTDFLSGNDGYFYNGETALKSLGAWIPHDDVTGEASVTASANFYAGPWGATGTIDDVTIMLPTIPRATSAPNLTGYVEENVTLDIEPKSNTFRHIVQINFGSISKYLNAYGELVDTESILQPGVDSIPFTIPNTFYNEFTNKESAGELIITTQQQKTDGTWSIVGEKQTGVLTVICSDKCLPILNNHEIVDINFVSIKVTGNPAYLVNDISTAQVTVDVTASQGTNDTNTTIKSILVNGVVAENNIAKIPNVNTNVFTVEITNSRDMTTITNVSNGGKFIPYFKPTYEGSIARVEPTTGEVEFTYSGSYYSGILNIANESKNEISLSYKYKKKSETEWTTPTNPIISEHEYVGEYGYKGELIFDDNFDYTAQYDIQITVADMLTSFSVQYSITRGFPVYWWTEDTFNIRGELTIDDVNFIDLIYPVGSIYMSTKNTNPGIYLGGTWEAWGSGRVPVGVDTSQEEFNQVEKTGGSKTHTLTVEELPSHSHSVPNYNASGFSGSGFEYGSGYYTGNISTTNTGENEPHNILQPYITCYMWKRTA